MSEYPFDDSDKPYSNTYEHIYDICRLIRFALSETEIENVSTAFVNLRNRENISTGNSLPLLVIKERFQLSGFDYMCVMVAVVAEFEGDGKMTPSFALAARYYPFFNADEVYAAADDNSPLRYLLTIESDGGMSRRFRLKSTVYTYLIAKLPIIANIKYDFDSKDYPIIYPLLLERAIHFLSKSKNSCLILEGENGSGRRVLAQQICTSCDKNAIFVTVEQESEIAFLCETVTFLSVLNNSIPVICVDNNLKLALQLLNKLPDLIDTAILCCNNQDLQTLTISYRIHLHFKISNLEEQMRLTIWKYYAKSITAEELEAVSRYRLSAKQIATISCLSATASGSLNLKCVSEEVRLLNSDSAVAKIRHPFYKIEDVIAEKSVIDALLQIVKTMKSLPALYRNKGFGKLFPYGRGVGVLFHGSPGTGKTMSAYALAMELGVDVMKVDLAQIEDKYIGETEKRLSEVFEKAEQNNCLLFFDEADSLFAKRTEVTDSHDRHSNGQTAHLLQKMEAYDGIVVLSTNLISNIDPAFKRRLPFVVEFSRPDEKTRVILWQRFIPKELPQEELDFLYLAKAFELSPAEIKWTALSAAVYAGSMPLSMEHILTALRYEYQKANLTFPEERYTNIKL